MAYQLILKGKVQGVFCRYYCSQYAKIFGLRGSATNLGDGSVSVIIDTEDQALLREYITSLTSNPSDIRFFGRIEDVSVSSYDGPVRGDYLF
ncbi:MAG TPA: acylphosphatase [Spirochaetota bacterium]|nr:acylphosphatase [Spirochaetota bacterium]HPI89544.1 acylphosphatase [Spirochaetota bacterium]HPR49008.1 acylphosphatase [Spirochaetota bacterium]